MSTIVKLEHLRKDYAVGKDYITALNDINLEIESGEVFGIIGASGAGKSTLVRCLNLLEKPTEGHVYFEDRDLAKLSTRELNIARQSISMIFQQFNLLMQRSVLKNVMFPMEIAKVPKGERKKKALELLELVGLSDKANVYPAQLSGGQKQRVAIARALANNPKVLLCDEATSALDPTTTREVLALLKEINQKLGITIIIITHEMMVIEEICNRVAIIADSKIAEIGPVQEIFAKPTTEAGRKLVYPDGERNPDFGRGRCIRIVFDGRSSFEPVIANMILDCKEVVNIIYANTKNINGIATGEMVLQLPDEDKAYEKIFAYLKARNLVVEEVKNYV
ncbi:MAG: methionine ABC transporter ATP-binding protein [Lachnospiraceae bacterium]